MGIAQEEKDQDGGKVKDVFNGPRSAYNMRLSTIDIILTTLIIHVHLTREDRITVAIAIQTPLDVMLQNMPEIKINKFNHSSTKFTCII